MEMDKSKKVFIKLKKHSSIILLNKPIKYKQQQKKSDISEQDLADRWG